MHNDRHIIELQLTRRELLCGIAAGTGMATLAACGAPGRLVPPARLVTPPFRGATDLTPNPVVAENRLPGDPDWQVTRDLGDIEGFASATSITAGDTITIYVNTSAPYYHVLLYRSGYYGGAGGRLIARLEDLTGYQQPAPHRDAATGLASCAHWAASVQVQTGPDWVSGIYIAKLVRPDTGGEAHVYFVVRDDTRLRPILYQQSVSTYHAYNNYGGKSLYTFNSGNCSTVSGAPRAVRVSLLRPYTGLQSLHGFDCYLHAEYPLVRWLEAQGYDVGYCTNLDTHQSGKVGARNVLLGRQLFISSGHDEYWSQEMRDAITAARDAGVNLAFFSSNVGYWRVRFENDPWTGATESVMVCYKTTESGTPDPSGYYTGTWRDPAGVNQPEQLLVGMQYVGDNDQRGFPLRVDAQYARDRIYRHTGLEQLPEGTYVDIGNDLIGWEWDAVHVDSPHPPDIEILAATPVYGPLLADAGHLYTVQRAVTHVIRYRASSGAQVFASGTNRWSWGLELVEPDPRLRQITCNLLADMGVQPATPASDLVLDEMPVLRPASGKAALRTGAVPVISKLTVSSEDDTLVIRWETDIDTTGQVWLREQPGDPWAPPLVAGEVHRHLTRQHEIRLAWLLSGQRYYLQVAAASATGQVAITDAIEAEFSGASLRGRARGMLRPMYASTARPLVCWSEQHPVLAGILTLGTSTLAGLVGWRAAAMQRQRRAKVAEK
ncbi:MAG: hypothetical protein HXY37_01630 [Chloroflexi bacterium]|nr:hypothetical protein [Chloroflexota bacterium]